MKKPFPLLLSKACLLLLFVLTTKESLATNYYVKIGGSDAAAGTDWATAFATVQKALTTATLGDQIWVAAGTYYADEGGSFADNDRNASFSMKNGVTIYGGFAGNEAAGYDLSLRNFTTNATILSGDIDKNSTLDNGNSYHVVNNPGGLNNTAILDGFTLTGGNANGITTFDNRTFIFGGGMLNNGNGSGNSCNPLIRYCIFKENSAAEAGGAIYNDGRLGGNSSPQLIYCSFLSNTAAAGGGGAMFNDAFQGTSSPQLSNCSFESNVIAAGSG